MKNGANYSQVSIFEKVCKKGDFKIAVIGMDHGHIYGMVDELLKAGAELIYVYDDDFNKAHDYALKFSAIAVKSIDEILSDQNIDLVVSAAIASKRCQIGIKALYANKHFLSDKPAITNLEDLKEAKKAVLESKKIFAVCYSERLHNESAIMAGDLIKQGLIGDVLHITGYGPHREGSGRPDWFYDKNQYGGILCDIGSHQIEQFLYYTNNINAKIVYSRTKNYLRKAHENFEDFGDVLLEGENGSTGYFKVDWFTPDKLSNWGDGRIFITGTKGTIELRKYLDVAKNKSENNIYLVNDDGEQYLNATGVTGFPFFRTLILDCLNKTFNAQNQEMAFNAAELSILAQMNALKVGE